VQSSPLEENAIHPYLEEHEDFDIGEKLYDAVLEMYEYEEKIQTGSEEDCDCLSVLRQGHAAVTAADISPAFC